jgi:hypothetical protein
LTEIKKQYLETKKVDVAALKEIKETSIYPRVYEKETAWRYEILQNDIPIVVQDFYPGASGYVPMTFEQATKFADEIATRMREAEHGDNE